MYGQFDSDHTASYCLRFTDLSFTFIDSVQFVILLNYNDDDDDDDDDDDECCVWLQHASRIRVRS